ncbi:MAG: hypothetical protein ACRDD7_03470 [Peptostreptococcaceae bacterium]
MEINQYNEILNKVYNRLSSNMRLMKLLYYTDNLNLDIDKATDLSPEQLKVVKDKWLRKLLDIKMINAEPRAYVCLEYENVNFNNTSSRNRNATQPYWSNIILNIHIVIANNIEIIRGVSRMLELISEIQNALHTQNVDAVGNCMVVNIARSRVTEDNTSMVVTTRFYDTTMDGDSM